jgi:hypothetical protein
MRCRESERRGGGPERVVVSEDVSVYQLLITNKNNTTFSFVAKATLVTFRQEVAVLHLLVAQTVFRSDTFASSRARPKQILATLVNVVTGS